MKEKKIILVSRGLVFRTQTFMCNDNFEALVRASLVRHYKNVHERIFDIPRNWS